jgi:hypothetical protein
MQVDGKNLGESSKDSEILRQNSHAHVTAPQVMKLFQQKLPVTSQREDSSINCVKAVYRTVRDKQNDNL